jgi:hypothetical protein
MAMNENRRFQRIHFDCKVEFESEDLRIVCDLLDISFKGALIGNCSAATSEVGSSCRLILTLDESSDVQIIMDGSVAHKQENRVGIHCERIDLDSMTHLRKLVELNLGDDELLHREFDALLPEDSPEC